MRRLIVGLMLIIVGDVFTMLPAETVAETQVTNCAEPAPCPCDATKEVERFSITLHGVEEKYARAEIIGVPNCDCRGVTAGFLTSAFQEQCNEREQQLIKLAAEGRLNLQVGTNQTIVRGEFCDPVASGPRAWPLEGAPPKPPSGVPRYKPCRPTGLIQKCD